MSVVPEPVSLSSICSIIGLLTMLTMGLGILFVRGLSLVPNPPAIITAFI